MKKRFITVFSILLLTALVPLSAQTQSQPAGAGDFVTRAAQSGLAEVEMSRLAADKAQNGEVKNFAQSMVDDHTKSNQQLQQIAQGMGIQVPAELSAEDQQMRERLSGLSGSEFDRQFMQWQIQAHQKAVELFSSQAQSGEGELKTFASNTLPTLQRHLENARSIASEMGISEAGEPQAGSEQTSTQPTTETPAEPAADPATSSQASEQQQTDRATEPADAETPQPGSERIEDQSAADPASSQTATDQSRDQASPESTADRSPSELARSEADTMQDDAGQQQLPGTASPLPLIGLMGLLSIGASLALNSFGRR